MEELKRANANMADDKQKLEELLNMGGSNGELQSALQKMESELQDVLTQQQLFEEEKEEEIRVEQQHSAEMAAKLAEQDVQMEGYRRQLADLQNEGELLRLQGHMDGATKRLELADIEISMLKNELEAPKSQTGVAHQSPRDPATRCPGLTMAAPGACEKVPPATPPAQNRGGARPTAKLATPPRTTAPSGSRGVCGGTWLNAKDQGGRSTFAAQQVR